jgi:hypothetical protein
MGGGRMEGLFYLYIFIYFIFRMPGGGPDGWPDGGPDGGGERGRERGERGGGGTGAGTGADGGGERALVNFFPLYLYFADMASHVDIVNPTCPEWGNVITQKNTVKFKSVRIKTTSGIMS